MTGEIVFPWTIEDRQLRDNLDAIKLAIEGLKASNPGFTTGDLKMGAYSDAPDGWLLCDGSSFDPVVYKALYDKIGTTYGGTATAPLLPDFEGRAPVGVGDGDASGHTLHSLGDKVGKETHTLSAAESGVPAHTHTITDPGHVHRTDYNVLGTAGTDQSNPTTVNGGTQLNTGSATTGITINNNSAAAASSAHENRTPSTVVNFFIKT